MSYILYGTRFEKYNDDMHWYQFITFRFCVLCWLYGHDVFDIRNWLALLFEFAFEPYYLGYGYERDI